MLNSKIYIGNLSYNASEDDLRDFFSQYGNIESCNLIIDRDSGRSKGFAFITFSSDEEGLQALEANGKDLLGRNMNVNTAKPMKAR